MMLVGRCKGCEWTVEYELEDSHGYLAAMMARNEHIANCARYAEKKAECEAWTKGANEGKTILSLEDYERHRQFDPFLATRLNPGALEDLLDTALDTIATMAERALS